MNDTDLRTLQTAADAAAEVAEHAHLYVAGIEKTLTRDVERVAEGKAELAAAKLAAKAADKAADAVAADLANAERPSAAPRNTVNAQAGAATGAGA